MIAREDWDFLERLLDMSTVVHIFQNASERSRLRFHEVMTSLKDSESGGEALFQQYSQTGYEDIGFNRKHWQLLPEEVRGEIWESIDKDRVDVLSTRLADMKGLVCFQVGDENAIIRCFERGSLGCLRELVRKFGRGLRESLVGNPEKTTLVLNPDITLKFDNQGFAVLAKNPNS